MATGYEYSHNRSGDIVRIEITDFTRRIIYKNKFNIKDKNAIFSLLTILEKFSGISIPKLIREKMKVGEWF